MATPFTSVVGPPFNRKMEQLRLHHLIECEDGFIIHQFRRIDEAAILRRPDLTQQQILREAVVAHGIHGDAHKGRGLRHIALRRGQGNAPDPQERCGPRFSGLDQIAGDQIETATGPRVVCSTEPRAKAVKARSRKLSAARICRCRRICPASSRQAMS